MVWERHTPKTFAAAPQAILTTDLPTRLAIPSQGIDLPVYVASITENKWEISPEGVSYLSTSPLPGEPGNSVLYSHNWPNLLGHLKGVKPGDIIKVWRGAEEFSFIVHFVSTVAPNQTHIYQNTSDTRLTLYTCTGLLDKDRLVVTAFPE